MTKRITKAFADFQAEATAAAVRKSVRTCKARADIRWSAAMTLRDAVDAAIARA
jgi:hypothetical protein